MMQFSLLSLIPGLISKLQDCADPQLNSLEEKFVPPTSLKTSERASRVYIPFHLDCLLLTQMIKYSHMLAFLCICLERY
jgi:transport protein Avl9